MIDTLCEPTFRVAFGKGQTLLSLPALLAAAAVESSYIEPTCLRHQRPLLHMALSQLGALALLRAGVSDPEGMKEADWRAALLYLSGGDPFAWHLVPEGDGPAFFQPPRPPGKPSSPKPGRRPIGPADLDFPGVNRAAPPAATGDPSSWAYALISGQTGGGYKGRGHYGVAKMNGGRGHRMMVTCSPGPVWSQMWRRDVAALLEHRNLLLDGPWGYADDGLALTWLSSGDLSLSDLDPLFIDTARDFRLFGTAEAIAGADFWTRKSPRINAAGWNGDLGDFWTPVRVVDGKRAAPTLLKTFEVHPDEIVWARTLFGLHTEFEAAPSVTRRSPDEMIIAGLLPLGGLGGERGAGWKEISLPSEWCAPDPAYLELAEDDMTAIRRVAYQVVQRIDKSSASRVADLACREAAKGMLESDYVRMYRVAQLWAIAQRVVFDRPPMSTLDYLPRAKAEEHLVGLLEIYLGRPSCCTVMVIKERSGALVRWRCPECGKTIGGKPSPEALPGLQCPKCGGEDVVTVAAGPRKRCRDCGKQSVEGWGSK